MHTNSNIVEIASTLFEDHFFFLQMKHTKLDGQIESSLVIP